MEWTANNVTEICVKGRWTNNRAMCTVIHVQRGDEDPAASARDVLNNYQDHLVNLFANNYTLEGATYVDKNSVGGATGFLAPDPLKNFVGGQAGTSCSPNVAMLVRKAIAGHVGVRAGRMYLPPCAESDVDENGLINSTFRNTYNAQLASFYSGLHDTNPAASELDLVVVGKRPSPTESIVSDVTGLLLDFVVATMRRRLRA